MMIVPGELWQVRERQSEKLELSDWNLKRAEVERSVQVHLARCEQIERDIAETLAMHRRNWIRDMIAHFAPQMDMASMSEEEIATLVAQLEVELDKQRDQSQKEEE